MMDSQIGRDQQTSPGPIGSPEQQTSPDQKESPEQQPIPEQNTIAGQQTTVEQEPTSEQYYQQIPPDQITPEGNDAYLRQQHRHLRSSYPSCDLSEISYHTEQTDFPGSRHSSMNAEPLTLDADQIHDAKDQAVNVLQRVDSESAFDIFTKGTLETILGRVSMMEYYWRHGQENPIKSEEVLSTESEAQALADQINTLVEKAQQVVEANEEQSVSKIQGAASASLGEERKGRDELAASVEEVGDRKVDAALGQGHETRCNPAMQVVEK